MAKKYIDQAELISRIESEYCKWGDDYDAEQILGDIEDMPAVDIVRCGECKWFRNRFDQHYCCLAAIDCPLPDDYCSRGERKEVTEEAERTCGNCKRGHGDGLQSYVYCKGKNAMVWEYNKGCERWEKE